MGVSLGRVKLFTHTSTNNIIMQRLLLVASTILVAGLAQQTGLKAASREVHCDCQCSATTFRDEHGTIHGNCKTVDKTGAKWCYVDNRYNRCPDLSSSKRFNQNWSYVACSTPPRHHCRHNNNGFNNGFHNNNNGFNDNNGFHNSNNGFNNGFHNNNNGFNNGFNNNNNGFNNGFNDNNNGFHNNNNGFNNINNGCGGSRRCSLTAPSNQLNSGSSSSLSLAEILAARNSNKKNDAIKFE